MSAQVKTAAWNELLGISSMFRQNCALKHGLPKCDPAERISDDAEEPTSQEQPPPTINITNQIPAAMVGNSSPSPGSTVPASVAPSLVSRAAPWLLTAAGGAAAIPAVNWLLGTKPTPAVAPEPTPAVTQPAEPKDGSLLQYLQDNGYHLPEGGQWPTK